MTIISVHAVNKKIVTNKTTFFLTENGKSFLSNYMARMVREYFASIGINKPFNCTSFRKAAITHVTEQSSGVQQPDLNALANAPSSPVH